MDLSSSIDSYRNTASDSLFMRGIIIKPLMLKRKWVTMYYRLLQKCRTNIAVAGKSLQFL